MSEQAEQKAEKPKTLVMKLCEVMAAVERVAKRGRNEFHKYDYVTEADLADAIRAELASRHIFIFPDVVDVSRTPLEVATTKWVQNQPVESIRKTQLTEITVEWTFVDGESGEERTISVHGVGEDNVDKGFYKAFTGSEKYMLMKSFLIPTGDDPERDSKEDAKAAKERGKADAKQVGQDKVRGAKEMLFYTMPEAHNGHFAEFVNIQAYGSNLNEVAAEGLRQMLKKYVSKTTKENTVLVPAGEKLQGLLEELAGVGVQVKEVRANA